MRTYANPVIPGMHPDPSICRVGRHFYLVTSSFEYFPGIPLFRSRDLVSWEQLGHVLTRRSQLALRGIPSSSGIYAPTIRHAGGRFYVITTHVGGGGNFLVTASRPEGPWSDPIWIDGDGIDPSLLFARAHVYYTRNGPGADRDHPRIYQAPMDPRTGKPTRPPAPIWSGLGGIWPESPHLYKIGAWYYLLTAEGGTGYDHAVVVARSRSPEGPFESCPRNPVLTHRDRPRAPIAAVGHADLVQAGDGSWWAVTLGIRPQPRMVRTAGRGRGKTGDRGAGAAPGQSRADLCHHLGRETFLVPVRWDEEGWPVMGNRGRVARRMRAPALPPAPTSAVPDRDDFDDRSLRPCWNFLRNPGRGDWSLRRRPGFLRLMGAAASLDQVDAPSFAFLGRRQQHLNVRCRTLLEFSPRRVNEEAGLVIRATENFHYQLAVRRAAAPAPRPAPKSPSKRVGQEGQAGRQVVLTARIAGLTRVLATAPIAAVGPVVLQVEATRHWYTFTFRAGARTHRLGRLLTENLSSETVWASGTNYFTGAFVGLFATGNGRRSTASADFDWFDYLPGPGARG